MYSFSFTKNKISSVVAVDLLKSASGCAFRVSNFLSNEKLFTNKHIDSSFPRKQKNLASFEPHKCSNIGLCSLPRLPCGKTSNDTFLPIRQQHNVARIHTTKWHITQRSRSPWALRCLFVCTAPSLDTSFHRSRVFADVMTNTAIQIGSIFTPTFSNTLFFIWHRYTQLLQPVSSRH